MRKLTLLLLLISFVAAPLAQADQARLTAAQEAQTKAEEQLKKYEASVAAVCSAGAGSQDCKDEQFRLQVSQDKLTHTSSELAAAEAGVKAEEACKITTSAACKDAKKDLGKVNQAACEAGNKRLENAKAFNQLQDSRPPLSEADQFIKDNKDTIDTSELAAKVAGVRAKRDQHVAGIRNQTISACESAEAASENLYKVRLFEPIGESISGEFSKGKDPKTGVELKGEHEYQELEANNGVELISIYIREVYRWMAGIIGIVCVLMIVVSSCQIVFGGASPELVSDAKTRITQSILSLILLFATALILRTVNPEFFGL